MISSGVYHGSDGSPTKETGVQQQRRVGDNEFIGKEGTKQVLKAGRIIGRFPF